MGAAIKGITTAKGFHEKVPYAENADKADKAERAASAGSATSAVKLTQMVCVTGENNSGAEGCCEIVDKGIYVCVADITSSQNSEISGIYSGVIAVTDKTKSCVGSVYMGQLYYKKGKGVVYLPPSNSTVNSFKAYLIGYIA